MPQFWARTYQKISRVNLCCDCFEQSDWLLKNFWPIRMHKTNTVLNLRCKFSLKEYGPNLFHTYWIMVQANIFEYVGPHPSCQQSSIYLKLKLSKVRIINKLVLRVFTPYFVISLSAVPGTVWINFFQWNCWEKTLSTFHWETAQGQAPLLSGFVWSFHSAALGSSPKHTIYVFTNLYLIVSCGKDEN